VLIAIPTGVKIFNWLATVWGGAVRLRTPMLFGWASSRSSRSAGCRASMHSIVPSDHAADRHAYFVVAHFHYVLFGGLVFAVFGGFITVAEGVRQDANEKMAAELLAHVIGFNLTFFPMHFLGFEGQPRRTYTYPRAWLGHAEPAHASGAFIIATSVLVSLVNVISRRVG